MPSATLAKTARSLDQGADESVREKLEEVWSGLSSSAGGNFHAAEEVVLRWLLKRMTGPSTGAEALRRWPLSWTIVGCVFRRIPLFSLAKSLADRRFVAVVQQTVKEICKPSPAEPMRPKIPSDTDVAGPSCSRPMKRKRSWEADFDLGVLRTRRGCLHSANSLFEALRVLLDRADVQAIAQGSSDRIGAEHIQSLFCFSATEAMEILAPLLRVCNQALLGQEDEAFERQETWVSIVVALWNLHLQGPTDAFESATHLAPYACVLLGRLLGIPHSFSAKLGSHVGNVWAADLQRLMTASVVLPARSAFLNKKDSRLLIAAVGQNPNTAALMSAVVFRLALKAPRIIGDAAAQAQHQAWMQRVFEVAEQPLRSLSAAERDQVVSVLLVMAAQHRVAPPPDKLRSVCNDYALDDEEKTDWRLLSSVVACDADTFLGSPPGLELLEHVLARLPPSGGLDTSAIEPVLAFITTLARGYASARDLSGFVRKWFDKLSGSGMSNSKNAAVGSIWIRREICRTVADLVQSSFSRQQLVELLSWLETADGPVEAVAHVVVFDALSAGLHLEEYQSAVGVGLLDRVLKSAAQPGMPPEISSMRWRIMRRTLGWVEVKEARHIWGEIQDALRAALQEAPVLSCEAFEALQCSFAASMAMKGGGKAEVDARSLTTTFMGRLGQELKSSIASRSRLLLASSESVQEEPPSTPKSMPEPGTVPVESFTRWVLRRSSWFNDWIAEWRGELAGSCSLEGDLDQEVQQIASVLPSYPTRDPEYRAEADTGAVDSLYEAFGRDVQTRPWGPRNRTALRKLLVTTKGVIPRPIRERLMASLVSFCTAGQGSANGFLGSGDWMLLLSLMARTMSAPTYYLAMKFRDLEALGGSFDGSHAEEASPEVDAVGGMQLYRLVSTLTIRQMMLGSGEREKDYLAGMQAVCMSWGEGLTCSQFILLAAILSASPEVAENGRSGDHGLDLSSVADRLAVGIASAVTQDAPDDVIGPRDEGREWKCAAAWVALDAAIPRRLRQSLCTRLLPHLEGLTVRSNVHPAHGWTFSWKLRMSLKQQLDWQPDHVRELQLGRRYVDGGDGGGKAGELGLPSLSADVQLRSSLTSTTRGLGELELSCHLRDLVLGLEGEGPSLERLHAIHIVVKSILAGSTEWPLARGGPDLASAHRVLTEMLPRANSSAELVIMTQTLVAMLDEKASAMSQWNVEATLRCVSTACLDTTMALGIRSWPQAYPLFCSLVEAVIKRHRQRLEGHFHLLIASLQALLIFLVSRVGATEAAVAVNASRGGSRRQDAWAEHGKRYSKLLQLVCEPSMASVARSQKNALNSATDAAKRYAGQHMYVLLLSYIKLQLEHGIHPALREVLEPGVFLILNITADGKRSIVNDAMDASGRAIFKEMMRRWRTFGQGKNV